MNPLQSPVLTATHSAPPDGDLDLEDNWDRDPDYQPDDASSSENEDTPPPGTAMDDEGNQEHDPMEIPDNVSVFHSMVKYLHPHFCLGLIMPFWLFLSFQDFLHISEIVWIVLISAGCNQMSQTSSSRNMETECLQGATAEGKSVQEQERQRNRWKGDGSPLSVCLL